MENLPDSCEIHILIYKILWSYLPSKVDPWYIKEPCKFKQLSKYKALYC